MGNYESSHTDEGQSRDVGCHLFFVNIIIYYNSIVQIYIYKEDCLSVCLCLSFSMHSQDTELKLYNYVEDSSGQVVE